LLALGLVSAAALFGTAAGTLALGFALRIQDLGVQPPYRSFGSRMGQGGSAAWLVGVSHLGASGFAAMLGLLAGSRPGRRIGVAIVSGLLVGCLASAWIWSRPGLLRAIRADAMLPPPVFFAGFALAGLTAAAAMVRS
jgi:hypothetical protein